MRNYLKNSFLIENIILMNSSENNSLIKNVVSDAEPNLIHNNLTFEKIRDKSNDKSNDRSNDRSKDRSKDNFSDSDRSNESVEHIVKKFGDLESAETDMLFNLLANEDKLVSESARVPYEKPDSDKKDDYKDDYYKDDSRYNSETLDDYLDKNKGSNDYTQENTDYYTTKPQPSQHGPSFGDGPSIPQDDNSFTDDNEFKNKEEEMLAKLDMLRKLGELVKCGVKLSQNYNMKSDYKAMKYEYELHRSIRDKQNTVDYLGKLLAGGCYLIEKGNDKFNPFDFNLTGWSDVMNDDIEAGNYYDVIGKLYEKYFQTKGSMSPELQLVGMIGISALQFHLAHAMVNNIPSLNDSLTKNPDLAEKLRQQAVSDKVKQNKQVGRNNINQKVTNEHEIARKQATDINMLRQKEIENQMLQQQRFAQQNGNQQEVNMMQPPDFLEKQRQLQELQNQLNMQRSDTRSMYTNTQSQNGSNQRTMRAPQIPQSVLNKMGNQNYNQNQNNQQQELARQQQILQHKKMLHKQEYDDNSDTPSYDGSSIANYNQNLDNILETKFNRNNNKISPVSTLNADEVSQSDNSQVIFRRNKRGRKKNNLKIDT